MPGVVKRRGGGSVATAAEHTSDNNRHNDADASKQRSDVRAQYASQEKIRANSGGGGVHVDMLLLVLTVLSFATRLWDLSHPSSIVFDEIHFGTFAAHYLKGSFYFDVHPPLAKLMLAGAAWLGGGMPADFDWRQANLGTEYSGTGVPYVTMRALCAIFGAIIVPLGYLVSIFPPFPRNIGRRRRRRLQDCRLQIGCMLMAVVCMPH